MIISFTRQLPPQPPPARPPIAAAGALTSSSLTWPRALRRVRAYRPTSLLLPGKRRDATESSGGVEVGRNNGFNNGWRSYRTSARQVSALISERVHVYQLSAAFKPLLGGAVFQRIYSPAPRMLICLHVNNNLAARIRTRRWRSEQKVLGNGNNNLIPLKLTGSQVSASVVSLSLSIRKPK